ncbi:MAG: ribonuclease, partial [Terriglobales bacterium]
MNKELFVSTTPHETKVGITEDDQLAEIYLERENEYTLAGSIYKGRVTRVLPGMQSAFVDIGLERDAFLYVSDFMDLEQQDEDLDEAIPANRPVTEARPRGGVEAGGQPANGDVHVAGAGSVPGEGIAPGSVSGETSVNPSNNSRDFRGRRRRRGRRGEIGDRGGRGERPERSELRSEPRSEMRSETRPEAPIDHNGEGASEPREARNDQVR